MEAHSPANRPAPICHNARLVKVREHLEHHLSTYIARLKAFAGQRLQYRNSLLTPQSTPAPTFVPVFTEGFNDQILWPRRDLDTVFKYIKHNPYRLAVRKAYPAFFTHRQEFTLRLPSGPNGSDEAITFQAYGNLQLLENPFMEAVTVHRADSEEQRESNRRKWIYTAANGGVLVSPFISAAERDIRAEADESGGRFILPGTQAMNDRDKPSGHDFHLCASGCLLILTPTLANGAPLSLSAPLSRAVCLRLNALAAAIATRQIPHQSPLR